MKKLITIVLALAMILPAVALADLPDVSGLSDQELKDLIDICEKELKSRSTESDETVLLEYESIKLCRDGDAFVEGSYLAVPVIVYNDSSMGIGIYPEYATINGWQVFVSGVIADANVKKKGALRFSMKDADVTEIDQIDSLSFSLYLTYQDPYKRVYETEKQEHRFW